jgi:predicted TIM-barrel fold metal-dependent hydrolase
MAYIRQVFVNSETNVGVISGLPAGVPCGPQQMAETRDLINQLAGSQRALSQVVCDPKAPNDRETALINMEHQVRDLKGAALKCYTYSYDGWRLDDDDGTAMLEEATRLGITLVNTHKGLPAIFAPGSPETVRTTDYTQAVKNFPKMKFCAYHSGYFQGDTHPEGKQGIDEWIEVLEAMDKRERKRMYSEIGSTFGFLLTADQGDAPGQEQFRLAHLLGRLIRTLGSKNVIWGTDSVWWGSPQFLIDAFKTLQIPSSLQESEGYAPLTDKVKKRILGLNAAKLYGVKPKEERCSVPADRLAQLQAAQGGPREGRDLFALGPQTRRGFMQLLRNEWRPRVS